MPVALALAVLLAAEPAARPKLAVLDVTADRGTDPTLATSLTAGIAKVLDRRGVYEVISSQQLATLLGLERQRQLLGCAQEGASCLTEIADALGAEFVLTGTLARVGDAWSLTLETTNSKKARSVGRSVRIATNVRDFFDELPWAVAEATALSVPPRPSEGKVLPITLIGVGAASVIGGGVLGLQALLKEAEVKTELSNGLANPGVLQPADVYQQQARSVATQKTVSLIALCAGGALVASGVVVAVLTDRSGATTISLAPTPNGFLLAGTW
jgi:TolB-like protein